MQLLELSKKIGNIQSEYLNDKTVICFCVL